MSFSLVANEGEEFRVVAGDRVTLLVLSSAPSLSRPFSS